MSTSENNKSKRQIKKEDETKNKQGEKRQYLKERLQQRSDEARLVRKIVAIVLIVLTLVIASATTFGYFYIKSAIEPVNPEDDSIVNVEIPLGSSTSQIAAILEENGVINNGMVYRFYIKFNNVSQFQAGEYELSPSMTLDEITAKLQTGTVMKEAAIKVTIPEGKTIDEIASIYEVKASIDKKEFIEKVNDPEYIEQLITAYPTILSDRILEEDIYTPLEGYLFAATYEFAEEKPSIDTIVNAMLRKTENVVSKYLEQIKANDWAVHDALTMASLVENEARNEEERKLISGVFYNRLAADMMLQTDPTVIYALGEHTERVLYKHLEIDSPYNTYQNVGLPIGPISNFAENSLLAALEPEDTNYMYFVAAPNGEIYYSKTYEEHQQLVNKHLDRD